MGFEQILTMLSSNDYIILPKFYQFVISDRASHCKECLKYAGEIYVEHDQEMPTLPLHPNCNCHWQEVSIEKYEEQNNFEFGKMTPEKWAEQTEEQKYLWCNVFRRRFGTAIERYSVKYNIPKQLLAGVIANEMLDWKFPDGTIADGISGGGIGYAQIAYSTAVSHGISGERKEIISLLNSCEGSVQVAAKILTDYLAEFEKSQKSDSLGQGFTTSLLYYQAKPSILNKDQLVNIQIPEWLLNTMCAAWNSGIEIIYAKNKIGDKNYKNANIHGLNAGILLRYLPKLVK